MSKISYLKSKWFYHLYERKLELQIKKEPFPNHIAIILDGNRRWAKYRLWGNMEGHDMGADKAEELLNWIYELRIKITTLFVLSNDNLSREEREIDNIYSLLEKKLDRLYKDSRIHERRMKIKAIGSTETLPSSLKQILSNLENSTSEYDSMFLNIAVAYGGQQELVDAIKKVSRMVKEGQIDISEIDERLIESCLYTSHLPQSEPDLILRTSGEKRLSGFLIWQSAYSELVFMDVFWPEFRKIDLMRAIRTYQSRLRRYGR